MALALTSTVKLSSGHTMPRLGFGVYQNYDTRDTCLQAFKVGYRQVDSAQAYKNEAAVGEAVRAVSSELKREEFFITTKCVSKTHGYESTLKGVDESLARFGFDYIDLFLIHDPFSGGEKRLATYQALLESKAAGKIRSVGVSNFNVHHLEEIAEAGLETPSVNQIELHPLCQQRPIVDYCRKHNIVVQAFCPIIRGGEKLAQPVLVDVAKKHSVTSAQVLLRWSLQNGFVPVPKSVTPERISTNADLYGFELDMEDMKKLDDLDEGKAGAISWNPVDQP